MISTKHAKLISSDCGFELKFAPLLSGDATDEDYLALGWKKIVINRPKDIDESKFTVVQDGYIETTNLLSAAWSIKEIKIFHIISKYKFIAKLMEMDLWSQVKQLLEDNNLLDLFNAAQELNTEDQFFKHGLQLAKTAFSLSDEQIQQFIESII